jgi:hypothetical protein
MVPLVVYQSLGAKAWEVGGGVTAAASCDEPNVSGSDIMSPNNIGCLVPIQKFFIPSYRMFEHIHRVLNVDKKN